MRTSATLHTLRAMAMGTLVAVAAQTQAQAPADPLEAPLVPSFALGVGMLGFYGDVGFQSKDYSPLVSRIGYELRAFTPINNWLEVGMFALHGRLSAYEHTTNRRLNFESRITSGGVQLVYNFHHLLKPGHVVAPWVSVGFESIEFLSKTDLRDAQGRYYHFWSDGSIRNIAEDAPNAAEAEEIFLDYTFDSDIRETNADGFGRYAEHTWGIPVGVGAKMRLGHGFDARVGATMHFTTTDHIDGVTDKSLGHRKGDGRNDRFLFTSFSIGYGISPKARKTKFKPTLTPEEMDVLALNEDEDGDGVPDWMDRCPRTPPGVAVDQFGCPLDSDGDGVPDYRDDEPDTPLGNPVDQRGVSLTDDDFLRAYLNYVDSGNVTFIYSTVESFGPKGPPVIKRPPVRPRKTYVVKVGSQVEGISEEMIQRILSLPDVRTTERGDTTFYVVGNYEDLPDAIKRELQMKEQGFDSRVMVEEDGQLKDLTEGGLTPREEEVITELAPAPPVDPDAPPGEVVVRVQLGAFRYPLAQNIFRNITDLVTLKGDDGLTRYYTGSFTDVNQAAKHKVNMLLDGFEGAFLVAFRDGRRVSITEAGAQLTGPESLDHVPLGSINTSNLVFRIQVGTFAGNVPMETMSRYVELGQVKAIPAQNVVRYMYGEFATRARAEQARQELQAMGFQDAFVVGDLDGRIILAEDAERLQKQEHE